MIKTREEIWRERHERWERTRRMAESKKRELEVWSRHAARANKARNEGS